MLNTVRNYDKGTVTEMMKHKPDAKVKGNITVEVFNADGSLSQEAKLENIVMSSYMNGLAQYPYAIAGAYLSQSAYGLTYKPMYCMNLTDWRYAELDDTPLVLGRIVSKAWREATASASNGTVNTSRSGLFTTADGKAYSRMVYEWTPDGGNGTFNSIFLTDHSSTPSYSTPRPDAVLLREYNTKFSNELRGALIYPIYRGTKTGYAYQNNASQYVPETGCLHTVFYATSSNFSLLPYYAKISKAKFNMRTLALEYFSLEDYDGSLQCRSASSTQESGFGPRMYSAGVNMGYNEYWYARKDNKVVGYYPAPYQSSTESYNCGLTANTIKLCLYDESGKPVSDCVIDMGATLPTGEKFMYGLHAFYSGSQSDIRWIDDDTAIIFGCFIEGSATGKNSKKIPGHIVISLSQQRVIAIKNDSDVARIKSRLYDINKATLCGGNHVGDLLSVFCDAYKSDGSGDASGWGSTYILDSEYNLIHISDSVAHGSSGSYTSDNFYTCYGPYHLQPITTDVDAKPWGFTVAQPFVAPFTHSLLPQAITKNDTQSMRITYDILIDDPITIPNYDNFVDALKLEMAKGTVI